MRCLKRNKQTFSYCLRTGQSWVVVDENNNKTGENLPVYDEAVSMEANVSPAVGAAFYQMFGDLTDYDKVIVTDDVDCPITEDTVLFVDKEPEYRSETVRIILPPNPLWHNEHYADQTYIIPLYDYIVRRVSRSLNSVSIAIRKVKVS